jgi:hypothetical protein
MMKDEHVASSSRPDTTNVLRYMDGIHNKTSIRDKSNPRGRTDSAARPINNTGVINKSKEIMIQPCVARTRRYVSIFSRICIL